jgi:hypothetical protein
MNNDPIAGKAQGGTKFAAQCFALGTPGHRPTFNVTADSSTASGAGLSCAREGVYLLVPLPRHLYGFSWWPPRLLNAAAGGGIPTQPQSQ